jgi:hypothetical protein
LITISDALRSPGRLSPGAADLSEALDEGWWWGSSAPGSWDSPQTALQLSHEPHWHACDGPVAPIDTLVRRLDSAALAAAHAGLRDWWLCRPLPACGDRRRRWLELDGVAGRRVELWLHQVETGHQRLLLRSDSALLRHRVELPTGAADTVLWLAVRDEPVSAVGLWRPVRRVGERLAADAPALRARLLDPGRGRLALRLRVQEPLLGLSMVLRHAGRRWQAPMALACGAGPGAGLWQGLLDVEAPVLWWPHALGEPALHELELHALRPEGSRQVLPLGRIGWRQLVQEPSGGRLIVNGVPMPAPLRQAGWGLQRPMSAAQVAAQVAQARAAGIDLLDIACAGAPDADEALLDACDAQGLLIGHGLSLDSAAASAQQAQQLARWQARASLAWVRVSDSVPGSVITQVMQALPDSLCLSGTWSGAR